MSNLSRVIKLLADYATGKPLLSHFTPADHSNLAKVFGGEWTSRVIPCPESEQNVRRLALCDHYGIEVRQNLHIDMGGELEETEDLQKIPSRPCSRRQAPCGQCGRRVCVRCRIDVATAQKLLGIDHFYCLDVTLRGTLTFACRLCEPANEDHLCSCGRNPLKGRYSRQNNVCFHCFDKDLQKAGLGTFSYFHQRHERGYFFDDDENTLQVANCHECDEEPGNVHMNAWCPFYGGRVPDQRLEELNQLVEDGNGSEEDEHLKDDSIEPEEENTEEITADNESLSDPGEAEEGRSSKKRRLS